LALRGGIEIHRQAFGDIYDWAGQVRTVSIAKGSMFCRPQFIEPATAEICQQLRDENFLRGLARVHFVDRVHFLAWVYFLARVTRYLGEVNAVHPFREGNGRTQRAFFGQLAAAAGGQATSRRRPSSAASRPASSRLRLAHRPESRSSRRLRTARCSASGPTRVHTEHARRTCSSR